MGAVARGRTKRVPQRRRYRRPLVREGADESPTSLPVSYGYYADSGDFYFRLSFPPGSSKADLVERPVSFVVHGETDAGWRSVVATGTLRN